MGNCQTFPDNVFASGLHRHGLEGVVEKSFQRHLFKFDTYSVLKRVTIKLGGQHRPMDLYDVEDWKFESDLRNEEMEMEINGLIYVIDGSLSDERERTQFLQLMTQVPTVPLLVMVVEGRPMGERTGADVVANLDLESLHRRYWHIQTCPVDLAEDFVKGVKVLSNMMNYGAGSNEIRFE